MQGCGNKYLWSLKTPPTDDEDGACPHPLPILRTPLLFLKNSIGECPHLTNCNLVCS